MEDRHLSLSEVAGAMGVSERTIRRWIKSGKLRAYKPGRDYRIPESAVRSLVERSLVEESEISPKAPASSQPDFNGLLEEERRRTELDEVRESYREEREGVEHYLARWEQLLSTPSRIPEGAIEESLAAAGAFYPVLRGLLINEVTTIRAILDLALREDGMLPDEAKAESSLLPLVDRYEELVLKFVEAWNHSSHKDPPVDLEVSRELRSRRAG